MSRKCNSIICKILEFYKKRSEIILLILAAICLIEYLAFGYEFGIRLDQYAATIFSSIIGVVGTMFGLTAASYAFVWGELKGERESNERMKYILNEYQSDIWDLFFNTLIFSFVIMIFNLVLLGVIQQITDSTLYYGERGNINKKDVVINQYYNQKYASISTCAFIDIFLSIIDILFMGRLNYRIFFRQKSYSIIADRSLKELNSSYNLSTNGIKKFSEKNSKPYDLSAELVKIHYLEMLLNRIMKNHESEGDAFRYSDNEYEFLRHIIFVKLESYKLDWDHLGNKEKLNDLKNKCSSATEIINGKVSKENDGLKGRCKGNTLPIPSDVEFVKAYSDLIKFRNIQLICKDKNVQGTMIKCTIKKRLLLFLMSHERFDGMDLTNVSLSGADLSYSNFSNCNLKGVRLKGTNCKGIDLSNSRIPGIHFSDVKGIEPKSIQAGDVEITLMDDGDKEYNVYTSHQPTCLEMATFANADVSRMNLNSEGKIDTKLKYPIGSNKIPVKGDIAAFSLRDTNFDRAKLFNSEFNNIDLSRSSVFNAQMFNTKMQLVNAEKVNFGETVLTHSNIKYSCFVNANFQKAVMSDCDILCSDFTFANLSNTNFSNSKITYCNFRKTICNNTSFKNIVCNSSKLEMWKLDHISFELATLREVDFSNANLYKGNFTSANVLSCNFTESIVQESIFTLTVLTSTILNSTKVNKSYFKGSVMRDCIFVNVEFVDCTFENCDFSNSIVNCRFIGGEMNNVKFCNVKELNLSLFKNIHLNSVDFTGSKVQPKVFSSGVIWGKRKAD